MTHEENILISQDRELYYVVCNIILWSRYITPGKSQHDEMLSVQIRLNSINDVPYLLVIGIRNIVTFDIKQSLSVAIVVLRLCTGLQNIAVTAGNHNYI